MDPDLVIAAVAAGQHGVFTRAQAHAAAFTTRMIRGRVSARRWDVVHRDVFRIAGSPPTWEQAVFAAWLGAGEGAAVSHAAATGVWGIPHVPRAVEVSILADRSPTLAGVRLHRVTTLDQADVAARDGLCVTTPTRLILDLSERLDARTLGLVVDHCLTRRLTTPDYVRRRQLALGRRGRRGVGLLDTVLAERPSAVHAKQSVLETDLFDLLARLAGPAPVPQFRLALPSGRVVFLDAAWPRERVGVEAAGYLWHADRTTWSLDQSRWAEAAALGWRLVPVTWFDVHERPQWVLDTVELARHATTSDRTAT